VNSKLWKLRYLGPEQRVCWTGFWPATALGIRGAAEGGTSLVKVVGLTATRSCAKKVLVRNQRLCQSAAL